MIKEILKDWIAWCIVGMVGVWMGYGLANNTIRKNAIEQSCAHYDGKTGEFKWGQPQ